MPIIRGQPSALNTIFGWVIFGKTPISQDDHPHPRSTALLSALEPINTTLQRFWETEEVGLPTIKHPDDERCEEIYTTTTTRDCTGRYVVALPLKSPPVSLASTRNAVQRSYTRLERRLSTQPDTQIQYHDFMREYIELNHMSLATHPSAYIIPHHCVLKASSSTTKLRTVFNASYPDNTGNSLNSQLLSGPKLQNDICTILTSLRFHNFVVCADIKMMYRQILLRPEDRQFQHIFYRSSQDVPLQEFQLNTVTYGMAPSAYLAQRTLLQLVNDEGSDFPLASRAIQRHAYVDDIISGATTQTEARELIKQLISLLSRGGFELRKWSSNNPELLHQFPEDHLENPMIFSDDSPTIKILGLQWTPSSDLFSYKVYSFDLPPTKRNVLSYVARTFDPLGFITPITFWMKNFLKSLWLAHLDWDDRLTDKLASSWNDFVVQLPQLCQLRLPRHVGSQHLIRRILGFCDASERGYAAAIYLHTTYDDRIEVQLIKAKSRIAPVKVVTIPRLELCAALLLAKLYESVLDSLSECEVKDTRLHTDAQIVLAWLHTPPHRLKIFVANRITQILSLTTLDMWSHIRTEHNSADIASRGALPDVLIRFDLWWNGPDFLRVPADQWPERSLPASYVDIPELRLDKPVLLTTQTGANFVESIERFSSYNRLLRAMAYVLRFIQNCLKTEVAYSNLSLTTSELRESLNFCVKLTQQHYFTSELQQIQKNKITSNSLRSLSPFIDTHGLVRVGGRIRNASLPYDAKHPLLLPKKCHLSNLICDHFHAQALHAGPRTTQSLVLQQFWIISLRSLLRWRIHNCAKCLRYHAKPHQPLMSDLPAHRLQTLRAFQHVGIDFAGPFPLKTSKLRTARSVKGYLSIFVCTCTKAVHLECVSELSTEAFLAAFDRFVARRGLPSDVYSDNGTNFVGAARQFKEIYEHFKGSSDEIFNQLACRNVNWHFNPPAAPNFGGLWEAAVKSAKTLLHRTIGEHSLTFEEYSTLFSRIEAILNSRPLFEFSPDPHEQMFTLTPGHFLIGTSLLQPPEHSFSTDITPRSRWIRIRQLVQSFWALWSRNYLHTQVQRHKWNRISTPLKVGQVVIMYGTDPHPMNWPMGLVTKIHFGKDDVARVADVHTNFGDFTRPINKLVVVPTE